MVTRVPTRNHQVQSFWTAPIPTMVSSSVSDFLVVGKGGNEQHYEWRFASFQKSVEPPEGEIVGQSHPWN